MAGYNNCFKGPAQFHRYNRVLVIGEVWIKIYPIRGTQANARYNQCYCYIRPMLIINGL